VPEVLIQSSMILLMRHGSFFAAEITREQSLVFPLKAHFTLMSYIHHQRYAPTVDTITTLKLTAFSISETRNRGYRCSSPQADTKQITKKRKGQRSKYYLHQVPQGQFARALVTPAAFKSTTTTSNGFIIDSGATHHMVNKVSLLHNTQAVDVRVLTANQQALSCTLKRKAIVKTDTGEQVF
jgi:hypothetical protein